MIGDTPIRAEWNAGLGTILMDGRRTAAGILSEAREMLDRLARRRTVPCLALIAVGADQANLNYIRWKARGCRSLGVRFQETLLAAKTSTAQVIELVQTLNAEASVHGVFLQYPFPSHIDERAVFEAISPMKDVDGSSSRSLGTTWQGNASFAPCSALAVLNLLRDNGVLLEGREVVVIGADLAYCAALSGLFLAANATVAVCLSEHSHCEKVAQRGEVLISACGKSGLVGDRWLRDGAIAVDMGYYGQQGKGDLDLKSCLKKASLIAPVPGGVGPVTIAILLQRTVRAAWLQEGGR